MDFEILMKMALEEASRANGEVPVGAVIVDQAGLVIASGHNEREALSDASAHAEILAIRRAGEITGTWKLQDLTLVVTLEPCVMCAGAIRQSRLKRVIFGARDEKMGAAGSAYDILRDSNLGEPVEVIGGVLDMECRKSLEEFFKELR